MKFVVGASGFLMSSSSFEMLLLCSLLHLWKAPSHCFRFFPYETKVKGRLWPDHLAHRLSEVNDSRAENNEKS